MLKGQWGSAKRLATVAALAAVTLGGTGCTRIETGNVGIIKGWSGTINMAPQTGTTFTIFDSLIAEVDTTQTRIEVDNMTPKDNKGVALQNLNVVMTYSINPDRAPWFYSVTKELDTYLDDSKREYTTLGQNMLKALMPSIAQKVTERDQLVDIAASTGTYEASLAAEAQIELNKKYPGVFNVLSITTNHFALPDAIQDQVNAIAGLKAKQDRIAQEQITVEQGKKLEQEKATVEAEGLRAAMDDTHLTAEQLIAWKQAKAAEQMAQNIGSGGVVKTIDVGPKPAKP